MSVTQTILLHLGGMKRKVSDNMYQTTKGTFKMRNLGNNRQACTLQSNTRGCAMLNNSPDF